jgi:hypothetical protein
MSAHSILSAQLEPNGLLRYASSLARAARELHGRERQRLRAEIARVPGLFALLMKSRNGAPWSFAEREELRTRLRGIGRLCVYTAALVAPGTEITLPLLAWWLDRRDARRIATAMAGGANVSI